MNQREAVTSTCQEHRDNLTTHALSTHKPVFENNKRPAWMNWLFLGIFLWSSWQLAGFWFAQLHG